MPPLPTRLTFLSLLHTFDVGEKVRFLGCITKYDFKTATLTLQHNISSTPTPNLNLNPNPNDPIPSSPITIKASVDITPLLGTLKTTETQFGAWVYVIGYIQTKTKTKTKAKARSGSRTHPRPEPKEQNQNQDQAQVEQKKLLEMDVGLQGLVIWSAENIKLDEYERVVGERLRMEKGENQGKGKLKE